MKRVSSVLEGRVPPRPFFREFCKSLNCFVPADLKITGPTADSVGLEQYAAAVFERAEKAQVELVVFGSGGARGIPDGFDREAARGQIVEFCSMIGPVARDYSVIVALEPLNRNECNVMNTVAECADIVRQVNHPAVRLLVDAFHWLKENDSVDDIVGNGDLLVHTHIATASNRLAPGAEPCDLASFFSGLARAGYGGRISIEGGIPNPSEDLPRALALMKSESGAGHHSVS